MNKFSDSICIDYSKNKLLNGIAWNIILKSDTTKIIYKPGDIYGYYDDGIKYRYYEEKGVFTPYGYFEILDTKGLIIYFQRKHSKYGSYENYYYSSQDSGKIKSLSNSNLESDFQNPDFVNEIKSLKNLVAKLNENYQLNIIYDKYYSAK